FSPVANNLHTISLHVALPISEDSLKVAESSFRLHRRRSLATIVVGGLLSILLPTLVALPAAVYRVAERLRNPDDRRRSPRGASRSEEHTSELQSREKFVCRLL